MFQFKPKRTPAVYAIVIWMVINAVFMALELTVFNDAADLNNSILLILWVVSTAGLLRTKRFGTAITIFTLIYAFSFNAFNLIYLGVYLLNGVSAVLNAVAFIYMLAVTVRNS